MAAELTHEFLNESFEAFEAEPRFKLARNTVTSTEWGPALMDRSHVQSLNHVFSKRLPDAKICNQKSSGRCWLFACSTLMRRALQKKYNLDPDFELSQTYLFFWDKLEKCNWCLENVIATADEPVDSRLVQYILTDPTCDGGQWEMIVNVVEKYGVVPKNVYGEFISSELSAHLNVFLKSKLREFAEELRSLHASGIEIESIRARKAEMMQVIHRILIIHLGTPPTKFDFSVQDKEKKHVYFPDLTPQAFYAEHVPVKVSEMVSIVNDPRHDYDITMTVDKLGNVVGGKRVFYINTPIDALWKYAKTTIDNDLPVWFGCDVGKASSLKKLGIMSTKLYDFDLAFGTTLGQDKAGRLRHKESEMTHAMVFTGYNVKPDEEKPDKWRVENSWGTERGDSGYDVMTADWFDEHMYQVVVDKASLTPEHLALLEANDPIVLPAWDPMGSLA
ncbi:hypothetical protein SDRG_13709 [Saprolegnia diclina VS20]|uniref:Bleomycin hydrolase n=1 Tax=Saprolegnia diclina (strain VS20) TaxID=1156394 RepID=T0Q5C8_SAPDV|nr:hypothetical protein SDRG_13709 [Saprolegnia diclina VS20]EQC28630.1 hypothetical protein SDRG_13709 [Saprolegnia diclina VS20]|eukprot:XP_008618027.1 hypothetical protein SDRG_13709 [Saprolegnia diclina VS20]